MLTQATRTWKNRHKYHCLAPLFTELSGKNPLKQKDVAKNTVKHTLSKHHFQHRFCQINHASLYRPSIVQKPTIPIDRAKETVKINPCEENKQCQPLGTNKQIKKYPAFSYGKTLCTNRFRPKSTRKGAWAGGMGRTGLE